MVKNSDVSLILGLGISPGEGNGNPLQYSCLGNDRDRGAWWATIQKVAKSQTHEHARKQDILREDIQPLPAPASLHPHLPNRSAIL